MRRMILAVATILAALAVNAAALADGASQLFVIVYHQGPAWNAALPMGRQPAMGRHGAYMKKLFDGGATFAAGPTTDAPGGVVILRAASLAEAQDLLARDPSILEGMFVGEVHPWTPAFRSDKALP